MDARRRVGMDVHEPMASQCEDGPTLSRPRRRWLSQGAQVGDPWSQAQKKNRALARRKFCRRASAQEGRATSGVRGGGWVG